MSKDLLVNNVFGKYSSLRKSVPNEPTLRSRDPSICSTASLIISIHIFYKLPGSPSIKSSQSVASTAKRELNKTYHRRVNATHG